MAHDVFISYGHPDRQVADAVCARLEGHRIRCWIAPRDVLPGMSYGEAINLAIRGARVFVLVFSNHANLSDHVHKEVERAVSNGITIIPFRIENVAPSLRLEYFISSVHWLDAMTPPMEKHLEVLADSVERLIATGPPHPRPVPIPIPIPTPDPKPWLLYGAIAVLALAVVGLFLFRGGSQAGTSSGGSAIPVPQPQGEPSQVVPQAAPPQKSPQAAPPVQQKVASHNLPRAGTGIVGCWTYNTVLSLHMEPNGQILGFLTPAAWRSEGGNQYTATWPSVVDTVQVSADGRSASGNNNYGPAISAQRVSGSGTNFSGSWLWNNGLTVVATDGGLATVGTVQGRWSSVGNATYRIQWNVVPVDQLTLSADGNSLSGHNNFGVSVAGTRKACN